jgi:hypothetical protein
MNDIYNAPSVEVLGTLADLTLGNSGNAGYPEISLINAK